jgi:hypothetical protein
VLDSLPTYVLIALKLPKKIFRDMDKIRRHFLWAGNEDLHRGKCKVNWSRVCRLLKRGELGIRDLERFGRALRLRWLWYKWTKPDVVWSGADLPIDIRDVALFSAATWVTVGNGVTAKFWTSSWIDGLVSASMFPSLYEHSKKKNQIVAEALHNGNWRERASTRLAKACRPSVFEPQVRH